MQYHCLFTVIITEGGILRKGSNIFVDVFRLGGKPPLRDFLPFLADLAYYEALTANSK